MDFKKIFRLIYSPRYMFLKGMALFILLGIVMVMLSRPSLIQNRKTLSLEHRQMVVALF